MPDTGGDRAVFVIGGEGRLGIKEGGRGERGGDRVEWCLRRPSLISGSLLGDGVQM